MIPFVGDIPPIFDNLASIGILAYGVWMVGTGRLITRREAEDIRKQRDDWKAAWETSDTNGRLTSEQVTVLLEVAKVSGTLVGGLSGVSNKETP